MQKWGVSFIFFAFLFGIVNGFTQYKEREWKERDQWMDVSKIFEWATVETGNVVADIGCHEGYLSIHLAKKVGEKGLVFSVDVREDRLRTLKENAKKRNLENIKAILGEYNNPKLPEKFMDVVFVMDTYHEMDDYMTILGHIKKALKPGGRIVVLGKLKEYAKNKSREEQTNAHTLSPKYVKEELKEAGFTITKDFRNLGDWENESSKKIWLLVGKVPDV